MMLDEQPALTFQRAQFDEMAREMGAGAYKRMIRRIGFEPEDDSQIREYEKKAGPNLARFYARCWNYGRTAGASHAIIQRIVFGQPERFTRSIEDTPRDIDYKDEQIKSFVDEAVKRDRFERKYGD